MQQAGFGGAGFWYTLLDSNYRWERRMSGDEKIDGHAAAVQISLKQEFAKYCADKGVDESGEEAVTFVETRRNDRRLAGRTPRQWIEHLGGRVPFWYDGP